MTISPTPFAVSIADQLGRVLQALRIQYSDQIAPAASAAAEHRHFAPARQIIADADYIASEVERIVADSGAIRDIVGSGGAIGDLVYDLVDVGEITKVLDDIDPERLANDERIVTRLRESGNWTDEDEAAYQIDQAERAASYPQVQP
jgi:hypothetical protein